jgi:ketosteroid isomerase-like protein
MADCYAPRLVIEMPFSAGLAPERIETTREEIRARFAAGAAVRRYTAVRDPRIHQTADPNVMVLEYGLEGIMMASGTALAMTFVMVLTFRDGLIVHSRDYSDPIAGFSALGRLPELVARLTAETGG